MIIFDYPFKYPDANIMPTGSTRSKMVIWQQGDRETH